MPERFTLDPARWLGSAGEPVAPGAFLLFRREFELAEIPEVAGGWILTDTHYRLWVNGRRVQWGPALCDPRHLEADPVDLRPFLQKGANVIGVEIAAHEAGPLRSPRLIARLTVGEETLVTGGGGWRVALDPTPFDMRLQPQGWKRPGFAEDERWARPQDLGAATGEGRVEIAPRSIPLMREEIVRGAFLVDRGTLRPLTLADEANDVAPTFLTRDQRRAKADTVRIAETGDLLLAFELPHEVVGWPQITIDAPAGVEVEVFVGESRDPAIPWTGDCTSGRWRWISRGREETFEPFEYAAFRLLGVRVRRAVPGISLRAVGVRRRQCDFPGTPLLTTDDPAIGLVFDAALRTLVNSAQETVVDAMAGARRQIAGDGAHGLHPVRTLLGGVANSRRFLETFAMGGTSSGLWRDAWPPDRTGNAGARREESAATSIDRSIGFVLDHHHHWMQTGELAVVAEHWPRLEAFLDVARRLCESEGSMTPASLGATEIWLDSEAYRTEDEKTVAVNLYLHHMLGAACELALALAPARLPEWQRWRDELGAAIHARAFRPEYGTYVANPEAVAAGKEARFDDRSLAHHLLAVEPGSAREPLRLLTDQDPRVGRCAPVNAVWPYWALARHGAIAEILWDLRTRWAGMISVRENGTIGEVWKERGVAGPLRSHCAAAPLTVAHGTLLGLRPLTPGYAEYEIQPQLGDLGRFETVAHTPAGAIRFLSVANDRGHSVTVTTPRYGRGRIVMGGASVLLRPGMRETFSLGATI